MSLWPMFLPGIWLCLFVVSLPTRGERCCLSHLCSIPEYGEWNLVGTRLEFVGLMNERWKMYMKHPAE